MSTAEQLISQAGLRSTKARIAVLNAIIMAASALSQPEILAQLQHSNDIDRVTIYRVLEWLQAHALIHKISTDDRAWKYQLNRPRRQYREASSMAPTPSTVSSHGHAHLQCQQCGATLCIYELAAHIPPAILETYLVSHIEINLKGLCPQCQATG